MRKILILLLCLLTSVLIGCGGSSGGTTNPFNPEGQTFRVQLQNIDTTGLTGVLAQALDANGQVIFGPIVLTPIPTQFALDLPAGSRELQVAFRNSGETVCVYQQRLTGSNIDVSNPICLDVKDFVRGISLSPKQATLSTTQSQQYTLSAALANGDNVNITNLVQLTSSNTTVATVNGSGLATAQAAGSTMIGAQVFFFTDSATLNVNPLNGFALQADATSLPIGGELQVNAIRTVNGVDAQVNGEVSWDGSNDLIATVSTTGLVTGVANGSVTISAMDPVSQETAEIQLQVSAAAPGFVRIQGDFEDISQTGTDLTIQTGSLPSTPPVTGDSLGDTDDGAVFVRLPFNFTLLGDTFDGLWMSTNGFLTTAGGDGIVNQWSPAAIPNTNSNQPHNLIAVLYIDLSLDFTADQSDFVPVRPQLGATELGHLYTEVRGTAPNRRVIFQWEARPWDAVNGNGSPTTAFSFQAKLFEGTNQMEVHYRDVSAPFTTLFGPDRALIGVMNNAGTQALTWIFGTPLVNLISTGDALRYNP